MFVGQQNKVVWEGGDNPKGNSRSVLAHDLWKVEPTEVAGKEWTFLRKLADMIEMQIIASNIAKLGFP